MVIGGLVKYEVRLLSKTLKKRFVSIFACAYANGYMEKTAWIGTDNMWVYAAQGGESPICGAGVAGCCRDRPSVYRRERLKEQSGIN